MGLHPEEKEIRTSTDLPVEYSSTVGYGDQFGFYSNFPCEMPSTVPSNVHKIQKVNKRTFYKVKLDPVAVPAEICPMASTLREFQILRTSP